MLFLRGLGSPRHPVADSHFISSLVSHKTDVAPSLHRPIALSLGHLLQTAEDLVHAGRSVFRVVATVAAAGFALLQGVAGHPDQAVFLD